MENIIDILDALDVPIKDNIKDNIEDFYNDYIEELDSDKWLLEV